MKKTRSISNEGRGSLNTMTLKYEILKRLVKAANIKKMWTGMSTEELLENRRKQNAKNRIPDLKDEAFDISRIENGNANPSLKTMKRIASGLGKRLEIRIV